jgi:hypothetical protein
MNEMMENNEEIKIVSQSFERRRLKCTRNDDEVYLKLNHHHGNAIYGNAIYGNAISYCTYTFVHVEFYYVIEDRRVGAFYTFVHVAFHYVIEVMN